MNIQSKKIIRLFLIFSLILSMAIPPITFANTITTLTVRDMNDGVSPLLLAETILGSGVQARKVGGGAIDQSIFTGSKLSAGVFTGGLGTFGIKDGIVLSTGKAKDLVGPNDSTSKQTDLALPGDTDLANLINVPVTDLFDSTSMEFEFKLPTPNVDRVVFRFVLASEEYPEYINTFHDVIGLFVNGTNVAVVPNSTPTREVSIGSINSNINSTLYRDNNLQTNAPFSTQMDGFTTVLTATANIVPNSWNRIKLAIADNVDSNYDSNLLIEAKSLSAPGGLTASNITGEGFTLSWSPIQNVKNYDVYFQRTVGDKVEEQFVAPTTTTSFTFTGLAEFKDYTVVVKSKDVNGIDSPSSPPLTVRTKDVTPPTSPTDVTVLQVGSDEVGLVWTSGKDSFSGVKNYVMYVDNNVVGQTNSTSYTFTNLQQSTKYVFGVATVDVDGNVSTRTNVNVTTTDGIAPNPPQVSPKPPRIVGQTTTTLTWDPATDNPGGSGIAGYKVYQDFVGKNLEDLTPICVTKFLACEINNLVLNTDYIYGVVSEDNAGNVSGISEESTVSFKTLDGSSTDLTAPTAPGIPTVSARTATTFQLNWGASTDAGGSGLAGYELYLDNLVYNTAAASTRSLVFTGLSPETTYQVKIRAVDGAGNKSDFREVTAITTKDLQPPTVPTGLVATNKTDKSFTLTWNPSVDNIELEGYEIYRDGALIGTSEQASFDVTGLSAGKTYKMTVRSMDKAGNKSAASAVLNVQINTDNSPPSKPFGLEATDIDSTSFELSWDPATDNVGVTSYDIYNGDTKVGSAATEAFSVKGLTKATTYFFTVRAFDAAGNVSDTSNVLEVTTSANSEPPLAPDSLFAESITTQNFILIWERSEDDVKIDYYDIYYEVIAGDGVTVLQPRAKVKSVKEPISTTAVNAQTVIGSGVGTDVPLVEGNTYNVSIKSIDTDGNESTEFSDVLPVLIVDSNKGPTVTVTRARGDLTKNGVSLNYRIGNKLVTDAAETPGYLTNANVSCYLGNTSGARVVQMYPRTSNPKTSFKRMLRVGKNRCALNVTARSIRDGTYYAYLVVEHPTDPSLRTMVIRTVKVDKTAPVISAVSKSNDIYAPDGSLNTSITFTTNEESRVSLRILNSEGKPVRTLSRKTSLLAGVHTFVWNGKDRRNRDVPDGTYSVQIIATNKVRLTAENNIAARPTATPPIVGNRLNIYVESKAPTFTKVSLVPRVIRRGSSASTATVNYMISERALVTFRVYDKDNTLRRTIRESSPVKVGLNSFTWNGKDLNGADLADGEYTIRMDAVDVPLGPANVKSVVKDGEADEPAIAPKIAETVEVSVNLDGKDNPTVLSFTPVDNESVSLVADGTNKIDFSYSFSEQVTVTITIKNNLDKVVRTIRSRVRYDAYQTYAASWNGSLSSGSIAKNGTYTFEMTAVDSSGRTVTKEFNIDLSRPTP